MFTPRCFKLKKGKEQQARRIYLWAGTASILLGACDYFIMKDSVLMCCMYSLMCFYGVSYCVLGYKECYKVKKFKGHKVLRWCVLVLVSAYCVIEAALYFTRQIDIYMPALILLALALFMSVTAVRNGYQ